MVLVLKLVLIWSTWGEIETVDHIRRLKYTQTFENNLNKIHEPVIKKCTNKPYTRVSFNLTTNVSVLMVYQAI